MVCNREQLRQDASSKDILAMADVLQPGPAIPKITPVHRLRCHLILSPMSLRFDPVYLHEP